MQKMIMIPEERYERMMESYDKAMEELYEIRQQLTKEVSSERKQIDIWLSQMDETQIKGIYSLFLGMVGK